MRAGALEERPADGDLALVVLIRTSETTVAATCMTRQIEKRESAVEKNRVPDAKDVKRYFKANVRRTCRSESSAWLVDVFSGGAARPVVNHESEARRVNITRDELVRSTVVVQRHVTVDTA